MRLYALHISSASRRKFCRETEQTAKISEKCNGCETWSLTLREEHRLRVFENRVLRRIFGPKREEVAGERKRLHKEELHNLCASRNIITVIISPMGGTCNMHGRDEKCIQHFGGKT
jgi:hypothetical protein